MRTDRQGPPGAARRGLRFCCSPLLLAACGDDDSSRRRPAPRPRRPRPRRPPAPASSRASAPAPTSIRRRSTRTPRRAWSRSSRSSAIPRIRPAQAGQGSGFVVSDDGEIVTNAHVVTDATEAGGGQPINEADEVYVEFGDRNQVPAEIVGIDPNADVALIKVDPDGLDLKPIGLGDSDSIQVGAPVAAIGSPFGQEQSLSVGIVSATDRSIDSLTQFKIDGAIQTDASINPGNSGGPLIGADGRVIGIDQQINTTSGGNEGVGFAVPINLVKRSVDQLRENGKVEYAYIGVQEPAALPAARREARHRRPDRVADLDRRSRAARPTRPACRARPTAPTPRSSSRAARSRPAAT